MLLSQLAYAALPGEIFFGTFTCFINLRSTNASSQCKMLHHYCLDWTHHKNVSACHMQIDFWFCLLLRCDSFSCCVKCPNRSKIWWSWQIFIGHMGKRNHTCYQSLWLDYTTFCTCNIVVSKLLIKITFVHIAKVRHVTPNNKQKIWVDSVSTEKRRSKIRSSTFVMLTGTNSYQKKIAPTCQK